MNDQNAGKFFVNDNRIGSKKYFQYLEITTGKTGKPELLRVSGKIGGSKREVRKRHASVSSAEKEFVELQKHFEACGYTEFKGKLPLN